MEGGEEKDMKGEKEEEMERGREGRTREGRGGRSTAQKQAEAKPGAVLDPADPAVISLAHIWRAPLVPYS